MVIAKHFTCPVCGWSITSPDGEEDVAKHVKMHKEEKHPSIELAPDQMKKMMIDAEINLVWSVTPRGVVTPMEYSEAWRAQENIGKRFRSDK